LQLRDLPAALRAALRAAIAALDAELSSDAISEAPTAAVMVLAGKLNKSLTVKDARSAHVTDFQARYAHAGAAPLVIATGGINRHDGSSEGREFARRLAEEAKIPTVGARPEAPTH